MRLPKLPTFHKCPINNCTGIHTARTSKRGNTYYQCDTCGAFGGSRFLTPAERAQAKARKDAQRARKATKKSKPATAQEVDQLPADGFDYAEWGEAFAQDERQLSFDI